MSFVVNQVILKQHPKQKQLHYLDGVVFILKIMPKFYYHATYQPYLESIRKNGLQAGFQKAWQDSKDNVVYLATSAEVAESYAETSELVDDNEDYFDKIVILKVLVKDLDEALLSSDENVIFDKNNNDATVEYHGTIPARLLSVVNTQNNIREPLIQVKEAKLSKPKPIKLF